MGPPKPLPHRLRGGVLPLRPLNRFWGQIGSRGHQALLGSMQVTAHPEPSARAPDSCPQRSRTQLWALHTAVQRAPATDTQFCCSELGRVPAGSPQAPGARTTATSLHAGKPVTQTGPHSGDRVCTQSSRWKSVESGAGESQLPSAATRCVTDTDVARPGLAPAWACVCPLKMGAVMSPAQRWRPGLSFLGCARDPVVTEGTVQGRGARSSAARTPQRTFAVV